MLFGVLVLVLAAFGLLVTALVTSATLWAWLSVGVSALAAVALVVDWSRRRARTADAPAAQVSAAVPPSGGVPDSEDEPLEEDTDAADLLVVADLHVDVRVIDERPRYHLPDCPWVGDRTTLGLPVSEARQLGFTPCAVCSPDRTLAAAHRTTADG